MRALPDILKEAVEGVPNCQYNVAYMKDHLGWANEVELIWYAAEQTKLAGLRAVALTFRIFSTSSLFLYVFSPAELKSFLYRF
jgi:hypothetical protein